MFQLSCSGVRYLSYGSVKYSFDITGMEATTTTTTTASASAPRLPTTSTAATVTTTTVT